MHQVPILKYADAVTVIEAFYPAFPFLKLKKKIHISEQKSFPVLWEQMVKMAANICWGHKTNKRQRTDFRVLQLRTALHCRAVPLSNTHKVAEQQSCESLWK